MTKGWIYMHQYEPLLVINTHWYFVLMSPGFSIYITNGSFKYTNVHMFLLRIQLQFDLLKYALHFQSYIKYICRLIIWWNRHKWFTKCLCSMRVHVDPYGCILCSHSCLYGSNLSMRVLRRSPKELIFFCKAAPIVIFFGLHSSFPGDGGAFSFDMDCIIP